LKIGGKVKQITIFGDEVNDEYKNYTHKEKIFLKDAVISMKKNFNNYRLVNFTFGLGRTFNNYLSELDDLLSINIDINSKSKEVFDKMNLNSNHVFYNMDYMDFLQTYNAWQTYNLFEFDTNSTKDSFLLLRQILDNVNSNQINILSCFFNTIFKMNRKIKKGIIFYKTTNPDEVINLGRYILSDLVKKFIIDSNWSIAHLDELHLRNTYFINTILWRI